MSETKQDNKGLDVAKAESRAARLERCAKEAAEREAEKAFVVDDIVAEAAKLAARGFGKLAIRAKVPLRYERTEHGKAVARQLEKHGFAVSWEFQEIPAGKENPTGYPIEVDTLLVRWWVS